MTLTTILNLAIGLTYVYLLLSLVASAVAEFIAGYWNLRGTGLKASIQHWLDDPNGIGLAGALYDHKLIAGLIKPGMDKPALSWITWLIPSVSARLPSYIPKETIADALIDILDRGNAFKTGEMQPGLAALWRSAQKSAGTDAQAALKSFRDQVMKWFDDAVSRQSENYTRRSQYRLFFIGLAIAIALNADTLKIASALWAPASIEQINSMAETAAKLKGLGVKLNEAEIAKLSPSELLQKIDNLPLPIGWGKDATGCEVASHLTPSFLGFWPLSGLGRWACPPKQPAPGTTEAGFEKGKTGENTTPDNGPKKPPAVPVLEDITAAKWLGWLITALAISFGAQFWFDALGSFVRLRSSGVQPKSSEKPAASSS